MIAELYATSSASVTLAPGEVHIWRFPNDQAGDLSSLSPDERAQAARFASRAHRDAYVAQHTVVRALLARYVNGPVAFERGPRGKPRLAGGVRLHHNLAHADDIALLAVSLDLELGIDLERYDAAIDPAALASLVLAPAERHCTSRTEFLRIWTRKEACLKATGIGLLDDLTSVAVLAETVTLDGMTVHVRDLALGPDHAAALATSGPCGPLYSVKS